jgi:FixJ family two-component response regulator
MAGETLLIVADMSDTATQLGAEFNAAGFNVIVGTEIDPPPFCNAIIVDVSMIRAVSPLGGLAAQRRMGCLSPAILFSPRLTEQMAVEIFYLGIKDFVPKPIDAQMRLQKITEFVAVAVAERSQMDMQASLSHTQDTLSRRLDEMKMLSRIGRVISSLSDLNTILVRIAEAGTYLTRADESAVHLLDGQQSFLWTQQSSGSAQAVVVMQPSSDPVVAAVLQSGKPHLGVDAAGRPALAAPVMTGGIAVGAVINYKAASKPAFEESDQAVLVSLSDFAAIALDKVKAIDSVRAEIDVALNVGRKVLAHAETLYDPVDGIESQSDTLLNGGFDPLTDKQQAAISRIKQATGRLKEIIGFIRETIAQVRN